LFQPNRRQLATWVCELGQSAQTRAPESRRLWSHWKGDASALDSAQNQITALTLGQPIPFDRQPSSHLLAFELV